MTVFFKKFPRVTLVFINIIFLILIFISIEFVLRVLTPSRIATIGHKFSENAKRYGWGFCPHELIKILDPDSGVKYFSYANNHGYRDLDRHYDNKNQAYRILFLGDSVTFGAIVPAEKIYTRILEERLLNHGYNVEVINMAYGGCGTDQELEILKNEGLKYNPNLIIVQFCTNDITENSYFHRALDKEEGWVQYIDWKPFYYGLDDKNTLYKKNNPYFTLKSKDRIKNFMYRSEILRHLYAAYLLYKFHFSPEYKYRITKNKLIQLEMAANLKKDSELYSYFINNMDRILQVGDISRVIESSDGYKERKKAILRILEDRWFNEFWHKKSYFPQYADIDSYDWKLYLAIIDEIKKYANLVNAEVAVFPETEEGHYQWSLSWYRVSDDATSKINYLSHIQVIKSAMQDTGIGVIENTVPYKRARNDPHPNIEGNEAMAEDIWKYLMFYKKNELNAYRILKISDSRCVIIN